ncbi:unnamed protein product, partial [Prorocentrum cordatum]
EERSLRLHKLPGEVLGAGLGNTDKGAVIFNIQKNGLLDGWNRAQELEPLRPGTIITEVNGVTGYWDILEALRRPGVLDIKVTVKPPAYAGPDWFQDDGHRRDWQEARGQQKQELVHAQAVEKEPVLEPPEGESRRLRRRPVCDLHGRRRPRRAAGAAALRSRLPCGVWRMCVARWLTGKCRCCPLCCRKVVCSPSGGNVTADAEELDR